MESSASSSDSSDDWIVLGEGGDEYHTKSLFEDDVSEGVECLDACVSDVRTTSLEFKEDGNPPANGEAPPEEDVLTCNHQNFDELIEDLSDSSSIRDELPPDLDMTPTVRCYVHNKNVNLNGVLNIYLLLSVTAAIALGLGNFLGWSYCGSWEHFALQKQEQMLNQLQHQLSDCILHLNASDSLHGRNTETRKDSMNMKESESQMKDSDHIAFPGKKDAKNLFPGSNDDELPLFRAMGDSHQINFLRDNFHLQNIEENMEQVISNEYTEDLAEYEGMRRTAKELISHRFYEHPVPNVYSYYLNPENYKETFVSTSMLPSGQEKILFNAKMKLSIQDASMEKHSGYPASMLHFNTEFPQKASELLDNLNPDLSLEVERERGDLKISQKLDVKYHKPKHSHILSFQENENSNHIADIIYSVYTLVTSQQIQNFKGRGTNERDLNITQFVFHRLLEHLAEKLDDIKNFTVSPLFMKHSYHGQKAVKELTKTFINFVDKLLKHSDVFLKNNIYKDYKIKKKLEHVLSSMHKLDCMWQNIKSKWHQVLQCEQSSEHKGCKISKFYDNDCAEKKFKHYFKRVEKDKPFDENTKKEQEKNKFFNRKVKEQKNVKSNYYGNEENHKAKFRYETYKKNKDKRVYQKFKKNKKGKHFDSKFQESENKFKDTYCRVEKESKKDVKFTDNDYKDKIHNIKYKWDNWKR